ncbi:hypothetical protein N802_14875 [Knoellia sinensis KCTC 19936]|uniref:NUDIX hydrolase n=1 Tax=Knoellia sinensis KCTC 19936 TaxID=1385520 RepID=A0A0A0JCE4_9MICO|nr:hypothetical protein [Knoellia sinensis]KGN33316.1 hypothetical protein N802_14875 [Knoellia sinensis KCTC 19936]
MDVLQVTTMIALVLLAVAWYLSYSASRLDRLHAKVEGAVSALDAQLVRRAEATLELATSGSMDPATSLLLGDAASEALERHTHHPLSHDLLDGQTFAGREGTETDLTETLRAALPEEAVTALRRDPGSPGAVALGRVEASALRVQLARRFHNDAVREVRRVRAKGVVRLFRLAGHAALPQVVDFDDDLPPAVVD